MHAIDDAKGPPMQDYGKYTSIWRKQPDGSWKIIVDMFNTDAPAQRSNGAQRTPPAASTCSPVTQ
jgi:hypothetical protein